MNKKKRIKWSYVVYLWSEDGNTLMFRKEAPVWRVCRFVAKEYLYRKYKQSKGYFIELN